MGREVMGRRSRTVVEDRDSGRGIDTEADGEDGKAGQAIR